MSVVFEDDLFKKSILYTSDKKRSIACTLKDNQGRYAGDMLRQDSKGSVIGRMIEPAITPDWLVPGTVLNGEVNGFKLILTVEPVIQSRIKGLSEILGDKVRFSYVVVSEFFG